MTRSVGNVMVLGLAGLPISTKLTSGPWTLILTLLVTAGLTGATFAGLSGFLENLSLVALIGFVVGVVVGSPHARALERGVIGLAIGSVGTFSGSVISVILVVLLDPVPLEVIPLLVALIAGVLSTVGGGACALGTVVGGFLRKRLGRPVPVA